MASLISTDNTTSTSAAIELTVAWSTNSSDGLAFRKEEEDEPSFHDRKEYLRILLERGQTWDLPHWRPLRWLVGLVLNLAWADVKPWRKPRCDIP